MMNERKYPVGIQTFSELIKGGYVYVDKTDLMWQLAHYAKYVFLSRPRRFGKSLLTSTLESYFRGEKELFEGLKVMQLEQEWAEYPVIHLDLSLAKGKDSASELRRALMLMLSRNRFFDGNPAEKTPGEKLNGMIQRIFHQEKRQVVVIIDEYDAPLLEVLHEEENLPHFRRVMQEFYTPLKASEAMVKFCFITGITKFSQLSIFSTLNNMLNVTMNPAFSAICGITEHELLTVMDEDIRRLAQEYDCSVEEMQQKLKSRYDGYHFSEKSADIYNPFSILSVFQQGRIANYWFDTGTPTYLIRQLKRFGADITGVEHQEVPASAFDQPTENMTTALPLLYQSGYLTIKDYDRESFVYTLSLPNQEVRSGYAEGLLPSYSGIEAKDVQVGFALKFWRALKNADVDLAMREMQAYLAGIPYVEGFKQKLREAATAEGFYEYTMYLIFSMLNVYVQTQVKCAGGRIDMVVLMPGTTYVMELKVNEPAAKALEQINNKGYALPYQTEGHQVVKVGIRFDKTARTIDDWVISTI
jgi:hypothetical protein